MLPYRLASGPSGGMIEGETLIYWKVLPWQTQRHAERHPSVQFLVPLMTAPQSATIRAMRGARILGLGTTCAYIPPGRARFTYKHGVDGIHGADCLSSQVPHSYRFLQLGLHLRGGTA